MKRKVNRVGQNTLTVSLPSEWARRQNVKAGDEISITEQGSNLTLEPHPNHIETKIEFDVTDLKPRLVGWTIGMAYKQGYDVLKIKFNDYAIMDRIESEIELCPGFELMEQSRNECVIKNIAQDFTDEFENAVRRNFLNSLAMIEACIEKIESGEIDNILSLIKFEKFNNKLTHLCQRMINTAQGEKKVFHYVIIWQIEKIIDEFKYICKSLSKQNINLSNEVIEIFKSIHQIFRLYYELYYTFTFEKLSAITELHDKIKETGHKLIEKQKSEENTIIHHLLSANHKIFECIPSTFALDSKLYMRKN